jgi:hypothetical protein
MSKVFAQCVLHIGTEKTGSTSIQQFLGNNRSNLARAGFFLPKSLSPYKVVANHEVLTTYALDAGKINDDLRRAAGVVSPDAVVPYRARVDAELKREIEAAAPADTLLLSNEHCHSRLTSVDEIKTLKDWLGKFARQFRIVVYLRPQHDLAISLYDQALKAGYCDIDVLPMFAPQGGQWVEKLYFDYDALLMRWGAVFGDDRLDVRRYSRECLASGDVIVDFMSAIGCDARSFTRSANANVSISAQNQPVLNAVNRYAKSHPGAVTSAARFRLISALQAASKGPGRRPSRAEAQRFLSMFGEGNERVRARFFPAQASLFNIDWTAFAEQAEPPVAEADSLIATLLRVLLQDKPANG